jgi:hypothetical protein
MGIWIHVLNNKDETLGVGTCAKCGDVRIVRKGTRGTWRCYESIRKARKEYNRRHPQKKKRKPRKGVPEFCDVCGDGGRICYDHDHQTGKHRGWLCHRCNTAIGFARDNPTILRGLASYLEK